MNLATDAMLVSLRVHAWSGRRHDRKASEHVAVHHDADVTAGRYNKTLLPKDAFAAIAAVMSDARAAHYQNTLPWDDQGARLLPVDNHDRYTAEIDRLVERMVRERVRFIEDYPANTKRARLKLGKLYHPEEYPSTEALHGKFSIDYAIVPVPRAEHFMAKLAASDTERVKRAIEAQAARKLRDAHKDLYRRLGEAVGHVARRLDDGADGKALVFRDSMIEKLRDLVAVVPRLNVFGDAELSALCREIDDRIARVDPNALRPSRREFDPQARRRVKRDADALGARFAGYFPEAA